MSSKEKELFVIEGLSDEAGNTYFRVTAKNGDKGLVKTVSYEQLLTILNGSYRTEVIRQAVGELPENYIDSRLSTDGSGNVKIYVPAAKRPFLLSVEGQKMPKGFQIPLPAMLFEICYDKDGRCSGHCCIVKGSYKKVKKDYYNGKLKTYLYPFGNVGTAGDICMGNIPIRIHSLKDAPGYVDAFFDGITNYDRINESRVKNDMGQLELLSYLQTLETFPENILIKADFNSLGKPYK